MAATRKHKMAATRKIYHPIINIIGNGQIVMTNPGPLYDYEKVEYVVIPDPGWKFDGWGGDVVFAGNIQTLKLTMDPDVINWSASISVRDVPKVVGNLTAVFKKKV